MALLTAGMLGLLCWHNFGGFGSVTLESQALPHLLIPDFCTLLEWKLVWGTIPSLGTFAEGAGNILNYSLQFYYQLVVLPHRISKLIISTQHPSAQPTMRPHNYMMIVSSRRRRPPQPPHRTLPQHVGDLQLCSGCNLCCRFGGYSASNARAPTISVIMCYQLQ